MPRHLDFVGKVVDDLPRNTVGVEQDTWTKLTMLDYSDDYEIEYDTDDVPIDADEDIIDYDEDELDD